MKRTGRNLKPNKAERLFAKVVQALYPHKSLEAATAAFAAEDYIDKFVYALQLRAGSQLDTLKRPARARLIHIPENLGKKK